MSPADILAATLPVFAVIALGFWFRRRGWIQAVADRSLLFLTVNVTYPCLILHAIIQDRTLRKSPENLWLPALLGGGFMLLGIGIAWLCGPLFGLKNGARRTFALACSVQNYGYLPIPIMMVLFPAKTWEGVLFIYSLGIELVLWTFGVALLAGGKAGAGRGAWRQMFNPVVCSILLGIAFLFLDHPLRLLGLNWPREEFLASWVPRLLHSLGQSSIPLGLLMVGVTLADLIGSSGWRGDWRTPMGGVVLRLVLLPLTMLGLLWLILGSSPEGGDAFVDLRHVVVVQAAMPAAVFPMIIARRYGGEENVAVKVIVVTTLISILTIPFAIKGALWWLGG